MKTMFLLHKLNKFFISCFICLLALISIGECWAETKWEVAVVFRGEQEDDQFQKDIDDNILELARNNLGANLKIGLYREMNSGSYTYLPDGKNGNEITLGNLLYRQDLNQFKVTGAFQKNSTSDLGSFLKNFYQDPYSKKALIIYSHGKGSDGLRGLSTIELKNTLNSSAPHLDLLWLDACFMANLEFLYELRQASDYTVASEEAEFTSGLPFQTLSLLPSFSSGLEAALSLSKNYIESYSYIKNGKQRNYVSVSSATISVIENKKLQAFAMGMKDVSFFLKSIPEELKSKLNRALTNKASMDDKTLIDIGTFLIKLREETNTIDNKLTNLIRLLNVDSVKKLKTNPRIHIQSPVTNAKLVYGFNNWTAGTKTDFSKSDVFQSILKNEGFVAGPRNSDWPLKNMKSNKMTLTPFAPGINTFNYYFLDSNGKLLSEALSISRTHDIVETTAENNLSPLIYTAYTQEIGKNAERYTGLNISMPGTVPSLDYFELEFNQLVQWLNL